MKILLLGADGQVGWELRRALAPLGDLTVTARRAAGDVATLDLADGAALCAMVRAVRPALVVNAAAYTAVDKAEQETDLATAVNATAPGILAHELAQTGSWLVHYSTDYVFDGSGHDARDETAPTAPLSAYGRSKLAGEALIRASGCQHLILRTSWVHAARGGNFARTMLRLAAQRDALKVVDDQIGAPTGADLLADLTALCARAVMARPGLSGTYHACAAGEVSWRDYARHVIDWGHRVGLPLRATAASVAGIPTRDYPTPATRPLNSRLDTRKLQTAFDVTLPHWQSGVDRMLTEALPSFLLPAP